MRSGGSGQGQDGGNLPRPESKNFEELPQHLTVRLPGAGLPPRDRVVPHAEQPPDLRLGEPKFKPSDPHRGPECLHPPSAGRQPGATLPFRQNHTLPHGCHKGNPETPIAFVGGGAVRQALEQLRDRRITIGMTLSQLAEVLGVDNSTLSRWENGRREPSDAMLEAWARALGCSIKLVVVSGDSEDAPLTLQEPEPEPYAVIRDAALGAGGGLTHEKAHLIAQIIKSMS